MTGAVPPGSPALGDAVSKDVEKWGGGGIRGRPKVQETWKKIGLCWDKIPKKKPQPQTPQNQPTKTEKTGIR